MVKESLKSQNFLLPTPALCLWIQPEPDEIDKRCGDCVTDLICRLEKVEVAIQHERKHKRGLSDLTLRQLDAELA